MFQTKLIFLSTRWHKIEVLHEWSYCVTTVLCRSFRVPILGESGAVSRGRAKTSLAETSESLQVGQDEPLEKRLVPERIKIQFLISGIELIKSLHILTKRRKNTPYLSTVSVLIFLASVYLSRVQLELLIFLPSVAIGFPCECIWGWVQIEFVGFWVLLVPFQPKSSSGTILYYDPEKIATVD